MGRDQEPVTIDRLPDPKWSKQKLELHPKRKALFPWWIWPIVILVAIATFIIVWFGIVLPGLRASQGIVETPTPTATLQPTQPPPTGLPSVPPTSPPPTQGVPTAVSSPIPTVVPTPPSGIAVGIRVRVIGTGADKLRLRSGPGLTYTTVTLVNDGHEFQVLEGPQEASGYQWWRLEDTDGTIGWAAANWLEPIAQ